MSNSACSDNLVDSSDDDSLDNAIVQRPLGLSSSEDSDESIMEYVAESAEDSSDSDEADDEMDSGDA